VPVNHLSQLDLARRWAISPRTLERWRWTGEGPQYIKLLGRVVYRLADIEAFENARLHESTKQKVSVTTDIGDGAKPPLDATRYADMRSNADHGRGAK
jgi:hypothetical protein